MAFQMWDLYRREVISEKVDIWVSAKHMNMSIWPLGYMSLNLKQTFAYHVLRSSFNYQRQAN